jgi:hypothetical protein
VGGDHEDDAIATTAVAVHSVTHSNTAGTSEIVFDTEAVLTAEASKNYELAHVSGTLTVNHPATGGGGGGNNGGDQDNGGSGGDNAGSNKPADPPLVDTDNDAGSPAAASNGNSGSGNDNNGSNRNGGNANDDDSDESNRPDRPANNSGNGGNRNGNNSSGNSNGTGEPELARVANPPAQLLQDPLSAPSGAGLEPAPASANPAPIAAAAVAGILTLGGGGALGFKFLRSRRRGL